jgi:hypothetical protein
MQYLIIFYDENKDETGKGIVEAVSAKEALTLWIEKNYLEKEVAIKEAEGNEDGYDEEATIEFWLEQMDLADAGCKRDHWYGKIDDACFATNWGTSGDLVTLEAVNLHDILDAIEKFQSVHNSKLLI